MGEEQGAREQRGALIGKAVRTADRELLGTVASVERGWVVIQGRGVARRVHVVPVTTVVQAECGGLYLTETMDDIVEQRLS